MSNITYGEVFGGIGSAVAAWKPLGWTCKYYVENNRSSLAHYLYNWNKRFRSYIDSLEPRPKSNEILKIVDTWVDPLRRGDVYRIGKLPRVDVMMTSPPCTSFTKGGNQTGLDASTGDLFFEAHRLIQINLPKCFIFENVPYMMDLEEELLYDQLIDKTITQPRRTFWDIILPSLGAGEIKIEGSIPFSTNYPDKEIKIWRKKRGLPWTLKRLPYNLTLATLDPLDFGIPMRRKRVFIVGIRQDVGGKSFSFPTPPIGVQRESIFDYVEPDRLESDDFRFMTYNPGTYAHSEAIKASSVIQTGGPEYPATTFLKHPLRPRRLTIKSNQGVYRSFSDQQRRRLMGFPDSFESWVVAKTSAFKNFGNAISVDMLRLIGQQLEPYIEAKKQRDRGF